MSAGGDPLVAVRQRPTRQVWVGFSSPNFVATAEFVVLWTNVLDDLAGEGEQYASHTPAPLTADWKAVDETAERGKVPGLWPGVYRRTDGVLCAVDAPEVALRQSILPNAERIAAKRVGEAGAVDLTGAAIISLSGLSSYGCARLAGGTVGATTDPGATVEEWMGNCVGRPGQSRVAEAHLVATFSR